jgi:hypothetical protein
MILRLFFVDNFYEKRLTFINFGTKFEQNLKTIQIQNISNILKYEF